MCDNLKKTHYYLIFVCFYSWKGYMQKEGSWVAAKHTTELSEVSEFST